MTADRAHRFLSLASMPFPTNDAFLAFAPEGLALLDASGAPRSEAAIAADVERLLSVWDAGTESNQAGAIGADMSAHQPAHDRGTPEGTVRRQADPVWSYPSPAELVRVTITPAP